MQLIQYNPIRDLQRIERDLDKLWDTGWGILPSAGETSATDLYEEDGKLVAAIHLPNFKKEEVKVSVENDALEVSAEHKEKEEDTTKRRYYIRETTNRYFRRITLPEGTKTGKADATFKDGMLKITMPMELPAAEKKSKNLAIH